MREVFAKLAMAEAQLSESKERPKGTLKVTATVGLGSTWLAPRIGEFIEIYPDVSVDLVLDDRELDLSMREADVAIRLLPPRQPELIQRHLMTVHNYIYAAPSYLKKFGTPRDGRRSRQPQDHRLWRGDPAAGADDQLAADGRRRARTGRASPC